MNPRSLIHFTLASLLAAPVAWAQDDETTTTEPTEPAAETNPLEPTAPTETAAAPLPGDAPFARIADKEETIFAIQRKAYLVKGKLELTPLASASFTDRFVQTFAPAGSVSYHLAENFAVELFGAYMIPTESGLTKEILLGRTRDGVKLSLTPEVAKLTQMLWAAGAGVQWSPIYGKVQIAGVSLGNFNFYIGAGFALGQSRVRCTSGTRLDPNRGFAIPDGATAATCPVPLPDDPEPAEDELREFYEPATLKGMGALSAGVRFYFSNWLGLKFEVKDYIFSARVYQPDNREATQRYTDAIRNNIFAQLGVSFLLGGEED